MPLPSRHLHLRRGRLGILAGIGGLVLLTGTLPAQAAPADPQAGHRRADGPALSLGNYDTRTDDPGAARVLAARDARRAAAPAAGVTSLKRQLGTEGIVDIDPLTGTARQVADTDGFLTATSRASAASVALGYVRAHPDLFGSATSGDDLTLRRDYVDVDGTHHLSYVQRVGGVPVFDNGLQANVAADGRLISVLGSPLATLPARLGNGTLSAASARSAAVRNAGRTPAKVTATTTGGATRFSDGSTATRVVFETVNGPRAAWQTVTTPAKGAMYLHVIDATSGRVLYRQDLVDNEAAQRGQAWDNYPGAKKGGAQATRNLTAPGWLPAGSATLNGTNAHVYSDVNDNNKADPTEEVHADKKGNFTFDFTRFNKQNPGKGCSTAYPCSWDPNTANSWQANRKQNAVQVFYYLGKYHDHLAAAPIGFTRAAGNFDARDGDAVQAQPDDGADTADGLPDSDHVDNANMSTPPDGQSPTMQMYLWNDPAEQDDGFIPANGGDEADIVYHEYTHGLSNRLVVDANGASTLGTIQAGSMGEAWSDWYAYDFLVNQGYFTDRAGVSGDLDVGIYVGHGDTIRTQPLDCAVGAAAKICPGTTAAGSGGYTYGDFGKISSRGAEVHADGEIWGETLWDLRAALGSTLAESLVTRAMELSPANPSYLDERNAILAADTVNNHGRAHAAIWKVFAHRGMGYFAGALSGNDTTPVEDFSLPPAAGTPTGTLTGTVTSGGTPVAGATVAFGGHASGYLGDFAGVTGADGKYSIAGIPAGTYPKVFATGPGYEQSDTRTVSVSSHPTTADWTLTRDWAAISGGATVADFNGPDYSPDCGPDGLYDTSQGHGWGSDVSGGTDGVGIDPRHVTVKLPQAVTITELRIDPSGTCGDDQSASAGDYQVETSTDGTAWTVAAHGHFTPAAYHTYTVVPLTAGATGVRYVRYTILGTQVKDYGISCATQTVSGCLFADSTEVLVHGSAS